MSKAGENYVNKGGIWGQLDCDFCHKSFRWKNGAKVFHPSSYFNGDDDVVMEICEKCIKEMVLKKPSAILNYYEQHFKGKKEKW